MNTWGIPLRIMPSPQYGSIGVLTVGRMPRLRTAFSVVATMRQNGWEAGWGGVKWRRWRR